MRWGLPATLLVASSFLFGCNKIHNTRIARPFAINSIVSLSPSTTEIVGTTNDFNKLKGRTAADNYPVNVKSVPIVASVKPDYEAIKAINPTVILVDQSLYNASDMSKIKALGSTLFVFNAKNLADFEKQIYAFGDLLGVQTSEADYVARMEDAKNTAIGKKPSKPLKVAVILSGHGGSPYISGTGTFLASIIAMEGGTVVGPAVDRFVPLNPETLTGESPDLVIIPTNQKAAKDDLASLTANPTLKGVKALQTNKVALIDEDVALRQGGRVDKLIDNIGKAFSIAEAKP
jgi:ABC-type Fe3+-hydroxamate transport system substrate-binding protein